MKVNFGKHGQPKNDKFADILFHERNLIKLVNKVLMIRRFIICQFIEVYRSVKVDSR